VTLVRIPAAAIFFGLFFHKLFTRLGIRLGLGLGLVIFGVRDSFSILSLRCYSTAGRLVVSLGGRLPACYTRRKNYSKNRERAVIGIQNRVVYGRSAPESIRPGSIRPTSAPSAVVPPQVYGRSAPTPGSFRPYGIVVRVHDLFWRYFGLTYEPL